MKRSTVLLAVTTVLGAVVALLGVRYVRELRGRTARAESRWQHLVRSPSDTARYRDENARLQGAGRVPGRVVFLGASITEAMDLERYFPGRPFVNRGVGGEYVWQQYLRLPDDVLALHPDAVVLKICAINLEDGAPPAEQTRAFFARMVEDARAHGVRPVLATVVPVSRTYERDSGTRDLRARIAALNAWIVAYARDHGDTVLNYAGALADAQGYLPDALTTDGLHPNDAGYARMVTAITATLPAAADVAHARAHAPTP